jgi:1-acyl-sn-glycerol-3-phosphate acyltransferase
MPEQWKQPGDQLPLWGGRIWRFTGQTGLRLLGWRFVGEAPNLRQFVMTAAPHTSNWDWVIGMLALMALGVRVSWLGKGRLFRGPLKWFFEAMNGIPVNRNAPGDLVDQFIGEFESGRKIVLGLAPEGTRSKVKRFRSGYYRIAHRAGVPVVPGYFNYPDKTVGIGPAFDTLDDQQADIERLQAYYQQHTGRNP